MRRAGRRRRAYRYYLGTGGVNMAKPVVAIVGRPNVGKSTLFNKLAGKRISIVLDTPGVTRDRIYADCDWNGRDFTLIDTGGIEPKTNDVILSQMRIQAELAIETADVVVFVVDMATGMTATDESVAKMLQKSKKKIILCVNKADGVGATPAEVYEFYNLGLGDPFAVSAVHGLGTGELLDEIVLNLPPKTEEEESDGPIKVAVIGKPNAGKSSLINKLLGEERVIVSEIAGTTRDAVDQYYKNDTGEYIFIDTAGIRKKSKVDEAIERYSVIRAYLAVDRADVCILLIDAEQGVTEQDTKIAGYAHDKGKASIIAVNKWDLIEKETGTTEEYAEKVRTDLSYMTYAPLVFISAKTGQRTDKLFDMIRFVNAQNSMRITTGKLNEVLSEATARVQPPTDRGKRLKVLFMTQVSVKPPTFVVFCNKSELFHFSYRRYIENQIRAVFGLEGTPIRMIIREREGEK